MPYRNEPRVSVHAGPVSANSGCGCLIIFGFIVALGVVVVDVVRAIMGLAS